MGVVIADMSCKISRAIFRSCTIIHTSPPKFQTPGTEKVIPRDVKKKKSHKVVGDLALLPRASTET